MKEKTTVKVWKTTHKQIRLLAAENGRNNEEVMAEAINDFEVHLLDAKAGLTCVVIDGKTLPILKALISSTGKSVEDILHDAIYAHAKELS